MTACRSSRRFRLPGRNNKNNNSLSLQPKKGVRQKLESLTSTKKKSIQGLFLKLDTAHAIDQNRNETFLDMGFLCQLLLKIILRFSKKTLKKCFRLTKGYGTTAQRFDFLCILHKCIKV
jgi:hypothetical protein